MIQDSSFFSLAELFEKLQFITEIYWEYNEFGMLSGTLPMLAAVTMG